MGYKRIGTMISFADIAVQKSLEHNRSVTMMERINTVISWKNILLKCLLLQKWFHITSDPELENQINDRISFKKFLGLPLDKPSPDHSTFSRFRSRLSKEAMIHINNIVLQEFGKRGLSINEGIAVDARLVKSASRPLSNDDLRMQKKKRDTPEGKVDKNGNPLKFTRDLESNWSSPGGIRNALRLCA